MLTGTPVDNFTFTFSIASQQALQFKITEGEENFFLSFFMSWHAWYDRELAELNKQAMAFPSN